MAGNGKGIRFLRANVGYTGDDCLIWPLFRNPEHGRGMFGLNGKVLYAHRVMCELAHGRAPIGRPQASHSCGKGHLGCVNPRHLSWASNSDNQRDRRRHGTQRGAKGNRTKLTNSQIYEIRQGKRTQAQLAKAFGVSIGCIQYWQYTDHAPVTPGSSISALRRS